MVSLFTLFSISAGFLKITSIEAMLIRIWWLHCIDSYHFFSSSHCGSQWGYIIVLLQSCNNQWHLFFCCLGINIFPFYKTAIISVAILLLSKTVASSSMDPSLTLSSIHSLRILLGKNPFLLCLVLVLVRHFTRKKVILLFLFGSKTFLKLAWFTESLSSFLLSAKACRHSGLGQINQLRSQPRPSTPLSVRKLIIK